MVLDPSTGEMVEAPQYGGTLTFARKNEHSSNHFPPGFLSVKSRRFGSDFERLLRASPSEQTEETHLQAA